MSCKNTSNLFSDTGPFGTIIDPYKRTSYGYNFSMRNLGELKSRGFSDKFLNYIDSQTNYEKSRKSAEAIRSSTPRQVTIRSGVDLTQSALDHIQNIERSIKDKQSRLENFTNQLATQPNNIIAQQAITSLEAAIAKERNVINSMKSTTQNVNVSGIDIVVKNSASSIDDNPLNCYMDVKYQLSLTMISEADAIKYQTSGFETSGVTVDINTLKSTNNTRRSITIASTGDILTNNTSLAGADIVDSSEQGPRLPNQVDNTSLSGTSRNYYNIVKMSVNNLVAPSQNNPLISNMLGMKMTIAEPHGFKLHEDIRDAGILLGYKDINPGRIVYQVDIAFSGYDQDTGEWVDQIKLNNAGLTTISSMMAITAMDASITTSGTQYELDLMPVGHFAFRPEDFVIGAQTIHSGTKFRDFLNNFATALSDAKAKRTENSEVGSLIRHYEFYAPSLLMDSLFDVHKDVNSQKQIWDSADPDHTVASGADIDILTTLQGALANTMVAQEIFNADDNNDNFLKPRVMFTIRFNTIYGNRGMGNSSLNDYQEITHQYIIEPYVTFKRGPVKPSNIEEYVNPQNQLMRVHEMVRMGMVRRVYNYINTSENTEVMNFDLKLKAFYFNTLNITTRAPGSVGGVGFSKSAITEAIDRADIQKNAVNVFSENYNKFPEVEQTIQRIFGNYKYDVSGTRHGASRLGGGHNDGPDTSQFGDTVAPTHPSRDDYTTYMSDYLSLDLLKLNGMTVRGDPIWLLSPYANSGMNNLEKIGDVSGITSIGDTISSHGAIQATPRTDQVIFLKMNPPDQNDFMNPNRKSGSSYPSMIGGFYLVTSVTSIFDGGNFTQSIDGLKLDHLNYVEELFEQSGSRGIVPVGQ